MADDDIEMTYEPFRLAYNEAIIDYNHDRLEGCIKRCREILARPNVPCDIWLRTIIILGSVIPGWRSAHACHLVGRSYWGALRCSNPVDQDAVVDAEMQEMRESLDWIRDAIAGEKEEERKAKVSSRVGDGEESMAKDESQDADAEQLIPEALLAAEPCQLETIIEELRELDVRKIDVKSFIESFGCEAKGQDDAAGGMEGKGVVLDEKAAVPDQVHPSFASTSSDSTELTPPSTPGSSRLDAGTVRLPIPDTRPTEFTDVVKKQHRTRLEGEESLLKGRMRLAEEDDKSLVRRTRMVEEELESLKRRRAIVDEDQAAIRERMQAVGEEIAELKM